jgi:hypothetical protein
MAKLTEMDKAANRAAQKVRDQAYRLRNKEYEAARDAAKAQVDASPEAKASAAARVALDDCLTRRDTAQKAILAQIDALKEELQSLASEYGQELDMIKVTRDSSWKQMDALAKAKLSEVQKAFPDVAEVDFVGAWAIPEIVQKQMDAAAEHARKTFGPGAKSSGKGPTG